jgi:sterol O-acyltransferase
LCAVVCCQISFTPRTSHFDLHNPSSQSDPFRGFYSLFWISMFLLVLQTVIRSLAETGYVLSGTFFHLITGDSLVLAASDAVMVGASGVCVLFVKGMVKGWWGYGWRVKTVQHAMQTAYLAVAVRWTFHRDWYWVQAGFLVLHCLSMLMKIHSCSSAPCLPSILILGLPADLKLPSPVISIPLLSTPFLLFPSRFRSFSPDIASNGALCEVHSRLGQTQAHLSSLLASRSGGETLALSQAAEEDAHLAHIASEEAAAASGSVTPDHLSSGNGVSIPSTPGMEKAGFITEEKLRQRLNTTSSTSTSSSTGSGPSSPPLPPPDAIGSTANPVQPSFPPVLPPTAATSSSPPQTLPPKSQPRSQPTPHALINHPDYQIRQLAENIDGMTREITSTGPNATRWPENVSAWNFVDYLLVPTLVYEMEYPRTNKSVL